ncbi:hypothetical protein [Salipiger sp. CCB-MM3]|uniref:hypothetical protein n=1 Tax=Salipiger sp. CCB-MM3 TaxID=1792508 RepID=UPI0012FB955F|nr:hypothetical protein [Salipiger sp. CCB-MM3]
MVVIGVILSDLWRPRCDPPFWCLNRKISKTVPGKMKKPPEVIDISLFGRNGAWRLGELEQDRNGGSYLALARSGACF